MRRVVLALGVIAAAHIALAASARAPRAGALAPFAQLPEVIGERGSGVIVPGDTLLDVADRSHVGFEALVRLNPGVDVWMPVPGTRIVLPTRMIPPRAEPRGLVLNLPEMRLYDYTAGREPRVFPIAIGAADTPSPVGPRRVEWKAIEPVWRVPASIRAVDPDLPFEVGPGPDNPLGRHWLGIGGGYGIHGTNNRWSIGRLTTHGCIRLSNADIAEVYARTPVGTPVRIVYQTIKFGRSGDDLFVEVQPDIYGRDPRSVDDVLSDLSALGLSDFVLRDVLAVALQLRQGIPLWVGSLARVTERRDEGP